MKSSIIKDNSIFNPGDRHCPISAAFNQLFTANSFQNEIQIHRDFGKGYCRRMIVKSKMEMSITDINLCEGIEMGAKMETHSYGLAFCLGEALQWRIEGNNKEFEIEGGECYVFKDMKGKGICQYRPGHRFIGLALRLDPELIKGLIEFKAQKYSENIWTYGSRNFYKTKYSPAIKLILNDIINCNYQMDIKKIYLEGKILELLATYLNELIYEKDEREKSIKLTMSDMNALKRAKNILDKSIVEPPTIGELARLIHLNEYKLKVGFKELYHMPVHTYIIDKRMELARILIEEKKLRVTEAAVQVGYSDASHFAQKFRKKYGINPSEIIKYRVKK